MFNVGDKVKTNIDDEIVVGVITAIHNFGDGNLYVIAYNGYLLKRRDGELEPIPEDEPKPDEITITREEFVNTFLKCLTPDRYPTDEPATGIALMVSGFIILKELEKVLFGEK